MNFERNLYCCTIGCGRQEGNILIIIPVDYKSSFYKAFWVCFETYFSYFKIKTTDMVVLSENIVSSPIDSVICLMYMCQKRPCRIMFIWAWIWGYYLYVFVQEPLSVRPSPKHMQAVILKLLLMRIICRSWVFALAYLCIMDLHM